MAHIHYLSNINEAFFKREDQEQNPEFLYKTMPLENFLLTQKKVYGLQSLIPGKIPLKNVFIQQIISQIRDQKSIILLTTDFFVAV